MKPLPTLTKPLRSVDIDTHEPAQALRERTDSCTVPAAGVVGEAMVALVLADAYRRKFGGDHIDDVLQAVRRLRGADRMAFVLIGFMGAGKSTARRRARRGARRGALDSDALLEERSRPSARSRVRAARRAERFAPPRSSSCASCSTTPGPAAVIALGGGSVCSERVRRRSSPHVTVLLDVDPAVAWERVQAQDGAAGAAAGA
jgi:shikimate kinase